jgi:photosystem II stability/assembly factor-like uncharacterized protein
MTYNRWILAVLAIFLCLEMPAQLDSTVWKADHFKEMKFRSIGPALMAGRIADIAIHPQDDNVWYVAVGSGGVWKTMNAGVSWQPIFDDQASYSIGCISIDPSNPHTIWVGTGENVGGRHVGYGDGIYRSDDGGQSWTHMGLQRSEHISKILIHPTNSNIIWVAAQGPLWSKGGERGVYKSTDGGKTWTKTLGDEEWTGATDLLIDPRNPDRLYAATWQRHRTIAAYLGGGPGSGIYRSEDGGNTWTELTQGLPSGKMGKIGIALSPQQPDVVYAAIELNQRTGGVYKSVDRGARWTKQSDAVSGATGPHYYQELYASPHAFDRIYLVDVRMQVSDNGGKSFRRMKEQYKHSDNHALAFREDDPDYLLVGTDGGLYESFDLAQNWRFIDNMPITQFYKIAIDDTKPFYNVYGGTQDNSTQGGPSQTDNVQGIQNGDWKVVLNWDGHQPATEPGNPNIMYGQRQQGTLSRIDLKTGEVVDIQPQPNEEEDYERFNWDAPILVSPHNPQRIYFGSQRLWKSENRGDEWTAISGDLTRDKKRIEEPIMGRKQSWDNAWDLYAMSEFSTLTSIAESPVKEGLIYVGSDDGKMHLTEDGGQNWQEIPFSRMPGLPQTAYINHIYADLHDEQTVYAAFDNHKHGDFSPYLYKSSDKGKSWKALHQNISDRTIIWRVVQDHVNKDLLFLGTEFGVLFSPNQGTDWLPLRGGLPTIAVRDIKIHQGEDDLVLGTFGRSIYILDDYSPLRSVTTETLQKEAQLFPVKNAHWYIQRPNLSFGPGKGSQGSGHYIASNPPFGASFTYHIGKEYESMKQERSDKEAELDKNNQDIPFPSWERLDNERTEKGVSYSLVIANMDGEVIRRLPAPSSKGLHRVHWDLRYPSPNAVSSSAESVKKADQLSSGLLAAPSTYNVSLFKHENGKSSQMGQAQTFELVPLYEGSLQGAPLKEVADFYRSFESSSKKASALGLKIRNSKKMLEAIAYAAQQSQIQSGPFEEEWQKAYEMAVTLDKAFNGSPSKNQVGVKNKPTINDRLFAVSRAIGNSTYGPTETAKTSLEIARSELNQLYENQEELEGMISRLKKMITSKGGPYIED